MFVEFERRQRTNAVALRRAAEDLDGAVETELRLRRDEQREPQVEVNVAAIVRGDGRMRVDRRGRVIDALGIDARRHETALIAERARIELRGEMANEAVAPQSLGSFDDFFFREIERLPDECERRGNQRNLTLQSAQQLPV